MRVGGSEPDVDARGVPCCSGSATRSFDRCDRVVALGDYMADRLSAKGFAVAIVHPVWSRRQVYPLPGSPAPRIARGLDGRICGHVFRRIMAWHRFQEILDAACAGCDRDDIVFLFVGDGPRYAEVVAARQRRCQRCGCSTLPTRPASRVSRSPTPIGVAPPRDDRPVRAGQALWAMASSRPGSVHQTRPLRGCRHDSRGRLRPELQGGRRRSPGRRHRSPGRRSRRGHRHGRAGARPSSPNTNAEACCALVLGLAELGSDEASPVPASTPNRADRLAARARDVETRPPR